MMIMSDPLSNKNQPLGSTRWELTTLKENKQDLSRNPLIAKLAQELVDSKEKNNGDRPHSVLIIKGTLHASATPG